MTHMVLYRSAEGQPVYHPTESLEDAARHLEQLRNAGHGSDARIFRLEEIPVEVKTYYRVELPVEAKGDAPAPAEPAAPAPAAAAPAAAAPPANAPAAVAPAAAAAAAPAAAPAAPANGPAPVKGEPATAGANGGRFGLFGKG
ncbi:MAG TPA: hypothetical protein VF230_10725 [Acidimicrobiales bacterium]